MLENRISEFLIVCTNKGLSRKTVGSYEQGLRIFERYLREEKGIVQEKQIKNIHIQEYIAYLRERGKYTVVRDERSRRSNHPQNRKDLGDLLSATTINNYLRNLRVFFNWLVEERIIKECPVRRTDFRKNPRRPLEYLEDSDFNKLINSMDTCAFSEVRDRVIIQLLLDSGMRIGECLNVKDKDLSLETNAIFLPAENTKGKKDRYVFFGNKMARQLRQWLQFRDRYKTTDFLFCTNEGKPLQVSNFEANVRKYSKRAGLENIHPHVLRNNFAKRFLMNGGDIYTLSRILGHSSVIGTEQAYLDLIENDLRKKYQEFSPLSKIKSYY